MGTGWLWFSHSGWRRSAFFCAHTQQRWFNFQFLYVQEQAGCHPRRAQRSRVTCSWSVPSSQLRDAEPALALLLYLHIKEESLKVKHGFHFFIKQSSGLSRLCGGSWWGDEESVSTWKQTGTESSIRLEDGLQQRGETFTAALHKQKIPKRNVHHPNLQLLSHHHKHWRKKGDLFCI